MTTDKTSDYQVANGVDLGALRQDVERLRRLGYEPLGGVNGDGTTGKFYQAMVRAGTSPALPNGTTVLREPKKR
jgi:peptidoglycan hydrolase-like protein with peptidoglycan-binding domain